MLRSMTAYGTERALLNDLDIRVELKSVNSRYFDCTVKLPRQYSFLEDKIRTHVAQRGIARGKLEVFLSIENLSDSGTAVRLDTAYAISYLEALDALMQRFDLQDDRTLMRVATNPGLFVTAKAPTDQARDWEAVQQVLDRAVDHFLEARAAEGARLCADLAAKKEHFSAYLPRIEALSTQSVEKYQLRLQEKIRQLLSQNALMADDSRILTEVGIYADRVATDEETVRLRSHLEEFDKMLQAEEPVGRKLDFLLQEMNRETNTIGSKANSLERTKFVIEMKNELEKIREQIQNIE